MELSRVIAQRRSSRAFSDRPVEPQKIERLLEAARWAPSASNRQPWRFVVVPKEAASRSAVEAALDPGNAWAWRAPVLLVACTLRADPASAGDRDYHLHDTALALMSLIHRAVDLGLCAHPMAGWKDEPLREALGIPDGYRPITVTALGYPGRPEDLDAETRAKDGKPRSRRPLTESVHWGRFGGPYVAVLRAAPERRFETDIPLRFADIDAMGHVNNAVIITLFEQSRLAFFAFVFGTIEATECPFVLGEISCRYRIPIKLQDQLRIRMHVTEVGRTTFRFVYELYDPRDGRTFAEAESVQVMYDYGVRRPMPFPDGFLAKLDPYVGG